MAKIPKYRYTGSHEAFVLGDYWYIKLKSSGTLRFDYEKTVDIFLSGGGGGGACFASGTLEQGAGGGGSGWRVTQSGLTAKANTDYPAVIGYGGRGYGSWSNGAQGGSTTFLGRTADGGHGGGQEGSMYHGGAGGSSGGNSNSKGQPGVYPFGERELGGLGGGGSGGGSGWAVSVASVGWGAGGGGGGAGYRSDGWSAGNGAANTGAGGGGGSSGYAESNTPGGASGSGGSGVIYIRGRQDDLLPMRYNGTTLSALVFNGVRVTGLIYDGVRVFAEGVRRCLRCAARA